MSYIRLLRQRVPFTLWIGQVASAAGDRLYSMAMLWIALQLTGSAQAMAVTAIAQSLAVTVVGLMAGSVIDRSNRIKIALWVDAMRAVVVLVIPIAHTLGALNVQVLIGIGTLMGALDGVFSPAFESLLPSLVSPEEFQGLTGLMDTPARFARLFGSGSAGMLLAIMPVLGFFVLDSASFGISVLTLGLVASWRSRTSRMVITRSSVASATGSSIFSALVRDVSAGFQIVFRDFQMLCIFISDGIGNMAFVAYTLGGLLLATNGMHLGLGGYGWFIAAYGIGSLVGNMLAGNLPIARCQFYFAVGGWLGIGLGFVVLGAAGSLWVALSGTVFAGACGSLAHVSRAAFIGSRIPHTDLGKVYSLSNIVGTLAGTVGTVLCGMALDRWTAARVMVWAGSTIVNATLLILIPLIGIALYRQQLRAKAAVADNTQPASHT